MDVGAIRKLTGLSGFPKVTAALCEDHNRPSLTYDQRPNERSVEFS